MRVHETTELRRRGTDGVTYRVPASGLARDCGQGCANLDPAAKELAPYTEAEIDERRFCARDNGDDRVNRKPCPNGLSTDSDEVKEAITLGCDWWRQGGH